MSTGDTCICGTKLWYAAGIGPYCPNKSCKIVDGPFDGSPSPHIAPPAEKGASAVSEDEIASVLEFWTEDGSGPTGQLIRRLALEVRRLRTPPQTRQSGVTELLPLHGGTSNEDCLRLVETVRKAMAEPHGDFIDQGLILVRMLAEAGYRIALAQGGRT